MRTILTVLFFTGLLAAQDMRSCPMHKQHMKEASQHQAEVEKHGDQAMGFPRDKTTHHFRLYPDGGAIEVTANDSNDHENIQAIRSAQCWEKAWLGSRAAAVIFGVLLWS